MSGPEQRIHARIHVSTDIDVDLPNGRFSAQLRDLSKGGARFFLPGDAEAADGDTVEMLLPALDRSEVTVMGTLVRVTAVKDGYDYSVRFEVVEPVQREALLELIDVLLSSTVAGSTRAHPRVARRIEIRFGQIEELRGILENISLGGLRMTVGEPLVLHEEVDITLPDLGGGELLILHARVVNQRPLDRGDGQKHYQIGLEFGALRPETKRLVLELLRTVVEASDEAADKPDD